MKIKQFHVKNQLLICNDDGVRLQSYNTIICFQRNDGTVILDRNAWDYSKTTEKYRNLFLGETKRETEKKIKSGEYMLDNLN